MAVGLHKDYPRPDRHFPKNTQLRTLAIHLQNITIGQFGWIDETTEPGRFPVNMNPFTHGSMNDLDIRCQIQFQGDHDFIDLIQAALKAKNSSRLPNHIGGDRGGDSDPTPYDHATVSAAGIAPDTMNQCSLVTRVIHLPCHRVW